jgi:thiol-disulfide isomerase/thioredoxin
MKSPTKNILLLLCLSFIAMVAQAQHNITGSFPSLAGQQIRLVGFEGFGIYTIDSTKVSEQGIFTLKYADKDRGMGHITAADNKAYFVVLANENIQLKGKVLSMPKSIATMSGKENKLFVQYASEHPKREQALSVWVYLQKIYKGDSLFTIQKQPQQAIETEMLRIKKEDNDFLKSLNSNSYISWYLPIRKLVSSVSTVAQYRIEEIPATIKAFRALNYTDERLYKSGLLQDVIKSHFWLIENSGRSLDSVFIAMNLSIDAIMINLMKDEKKLNEVSDYLFDLLERQSLFQASEYLALKLLNETSCTIDNDLAKQLETYRAMKKGNTAPDIDFNVDHVAAGYDRANFPKKLSDIQSKYTVVVFGASWCPKCTQELPEIAKQYSKWKNQGVEVVFVSLDEDKDIFKNFVKIFPFISVCDYQKWNSKIVKDYYVFGTPTMFLLNHKREILLRPNSVNQIDAWVDWNLVQGNKPANSRTN